MAPALFLYQKKIKINVVSDNGGKIMQMFEFIATDGTLLRIEATSYVEAARLAREIINER